MDMNLSPMNHQKIKAALNTYGALKNVKDKTVDKVNDSRKKKDNCLEILQLPDLKTLEMQFESSQILGLFFMD